MIRSFLAIPLPAESLSQVILLQQILQRQHDMHVKPADNLHCTLVFLGEIQDQSVEAVKLAALQTIVHTKRFTLHFSRLEGSKHAKKTVIWIRAAQSDSFDSLVQQLRVNIAAVLPMKEWDHLQIPHITLGTIAHSTAIIQRDVSLIDIQVDTVILYKSRLSQHGALYSSLQSFPLAV